VELVMELQVTIKDIGVVLFVVINGKDKKISIAMTQAVIEL